MRRTPRQGWLLAGLNAVLPLVGWVRVAVADEQRLAVVIALGWTALAVMFASSSFALHPGRPGR